MAVLGGSGFVSTKLTDSANAAPTFCTTAVARHELVYFAL